MPRYFITGGLGFIGSNLVRELVARGERPTVYDNAVRGRPEDLADVDGRYDLHLADVCDLDALTRAMRGHDVVIHLAALPSVARSIEDPLGSHCVNVDGALNALLAARDTGARRVVFASSGAVYGGSAEHARDEDEPTQPLSPYGVHKLVGEHYCRVFSSLFGLEAVALRYANVFGPGQDPASPYAAAVPRFISRMLRGEPPTIYGDGLQTRDFTYVGNVVQANLLAAAADGVAGHVFNVGAGDSASVLDLVAALNRVLGTSIQPARGAPRPGEVRHARTSIHRARTRLGYDPRVGLDEGLRRSVAWHRQRSEAVSGVVPAAGPLLGA